MQFFQGEQRRGIFGYLGSAVIANILNTFLSKYTQLSIQQSTFMSVYVFGNIILYSFDILFAKEKFNLATYKGTSPFYGVVPYTDIQTRLKWLGQSLYQKYIFRFLATVILDTIIGLSLLRFTIDKLDQFEIFKTWKYRNIIVATIVSAITYLLYLSTLRFKWAYEYKEQPIMNILVMVWLTLAILITVSNVPSKDSVPENLRWRLLYK
jgi:NADH:ubiquinone oxidoreductase subunit 6 (subunit J)